MGFSKILPPQPHFLSGYAGFIPGSKTYFGRTFGRLTHKLFLDKEIQRSDRPVLVDLSKDKYDLTTTKHYKAIQDRCRLQGCKYSTDIVSSYQGYIPQYSFLCGHRYPVDAAIALCKIEQIKEACLCPECRKETTDNTRSIQPLIENPDGAAAFKEMCKQRKMIIPTKSSRIDEPSKKNFIRGYTGHIPDLKPYFGHAYTPTIDEALKSFKSRYIRHKTNTTESFYDQTYDQPKPIRQTLPYESGIINNYAGHVPGSAFNVGRSFSEGSKNVRISMKKNNSVRKRPMNVGGVNLLC